MPKGVDDLDYPQSGRFLASHEDRSWYVEEVSLNHLYVNKWSLHVRDEHTMKCIPQAWEAHTKKPIQKLLMKQ